ncbi:MAG: SDR family oxidoreductase [Deltaproteobacteria bacterium]|nr:SDR family oxidoreductase [Deltaproteobacteria bacterium]
MEFGLKDRVALVTGAAQGIGRAIALAFAEEGAHVAVNDIDPQGIEELARSLKELGSNALPIAADVADGGEVSRMVGAVVERYGRIDILINNAGIVRRAFVHEMTEEVWDRVMDINLKGVFHCSRAVIEPMKRQKRGKIISASSILAQIPDVGMAAYSISKAGVAILTKVLAAELAPYNINVNAYAPGVVETPMTRDLISTRGGEKLRYISLRRFGKPRDIANLVLYLASDLSDYITGEVVGITGGNLIVQRPWVSYDESR